MDVGPHQRPPEVEPGGPQVGEGLGRAGSPHRDVARPPKSGNPTVKSPIPVHHHAPRREEPAEDQRAPSRTAQRRSGGGCRRFSISKGATAGCADRRSSDGTRPKSHGRDLPVAADPAVLPPQVGVVPHRKAVDQLDVGDETDPDVAAFDQVVAEDRVLGECPVKDGLESVEVVDPLPRETPFAKEILIDVRGGRGIRVEPLAVREVREYHERLPSTR